MIVIHSRKQIIENQYIFKDKIVSFLEDEIISLKKELNSIRTPKEEISEAKESIKERSKNINIKQSIELLFINAKTPHPEFYAWWDDENSQVLKYKYESINDLLLRNKNLKK